MDCDVDVPLQRECWGGATTCSEDDDYSVSVSWDEDGLLLLEKVPADAHLTVAWRAYDGLRVHEFGGSSDVAGADALLGEAVDMLLRLDVDVDGPIELRPLVDITSATGRRIGSSKLPPLRVDLAGGTLVVLAPDEVELDDAVLNLLPNGLAGLRVTKTSVTSQRADLPMPAMELDNSDKGFDRTGLPAMRFNVDVDRAPMSKDEFLELLDRAEQVGDTEMLWQAMQERQLELAADIEMSTREGEEQ